MKRKLAIMLVLMIILSTSVAFAAGDWGENAGNWIMDQVWWLALAGVTVVAVKLGMKKMWVQFGAFIALSAIVLVIVKGPEKLESIGNTLWNIIFK